MTLTGEEAAEVAEGKSEVEASEEVLAEEVQDQLQPPMRPIPTEPSKMVTGFFFGDVSGDSGDPNIKGKRKGLFCISREIWHTCIFGFCPRRAWLRPLCFAHSSKDLHDRGLPLKMCSFESMLS